MWYGYDVLFQITNTYELTNNYVDVFEYYFQVLTMGPDR